MKVDLQYRENSYFNETDEYVFYDSALKKHLNSKVHLHNGTYYTNDGLKYKATSLVSEINYNKYENN